MDRVGNTNPVLYFVSVKNKPVTGKKEGGLLSHCPLNLQVSNDHLNYFTRESRIIYTMLY
jgi:hypothetical protein